MKSKFTLIELFTVLIIFGFVVAIAVGLGFMVYLAFSDSDLGPKSYKESQQEKFQPIIEGADYIEDSPPVG